MGDTLAEQQRLAAGRGAWYQLLGARIIDGGHPFGGSSTITSGGTIADGAVSELTAVKVFGEGDLPWGAIADGAVSELTGYVIIEATDNDAANDVARHCPALESQEGRVEVYEALAF